MYSCRGAVVSTTLFSKCAPKGWAALRKIEGTTLKMGSWQAHSIGARQPDSSLRRRHCGRFSK